MDEDTTPKSVASGWLGGIGGLTTVIGAILLLRPIDNCGSVLVPDLGTAQLADTLAGVYGREAQCIEDLDAATLPAWVITCIGIALIVAAIIAHLISRQSTGVEVFASPHVSVAEELEKLESLRVREIITTNEFEQQKAYLLSRSSSRKGNEDDHA